MDNMDIVGVIINLISGGIGGNILGGAWKNMTLGTLGNSIAGAVGGIVGSYILQAVGVLSSLGLANMSLSSFSGNVAISAISGAVLTAIGGLIKGSSRSE